MLRTDLSLDIASEQGGRRRFSFSGLPGFRADAFLEAVQDPAVIVTFLIFGIALFAGIFLNMKVTSERETLQRQVAAARRDSTTLQMELRRARELREKRGRIERQLEAITTIDHNRYAFVHVMDQVAAATPTDIWIDTIESTERASDTHDVTFRITGFAGTTDMVGNYMDRLERSAFLRNLQFRQSEQVDMAGQQVVRFTIAGTSTLPDLSLLETEVITSRGRFREGEAPAGTSPADRDTGVAGDGPSRLERLPSEAGEATAPSIEAGSLYEATRSIAIIEGRELARLEDPESFLRNVPAGTRLEVRRTGALEGERFVLVTARSDALDGPVVGWIAASMFLEGEVLARQDS